MKRFATLLLASVWMLALSTPILQAQVYQQVSDSDMPAASMRYNPIRSVVDIPDTIRDWRYGIPTMRKTSSSAYGTPVLAGIMFNAYTSQSRATNQLGCNYKDETVSLLFRAGPPAEYPNEGNGSLVINTTYDGGSTWTGNSPIFNEDLPGNITGKELSARHPSMYAMSQEGTHTVTGIWSNIYATFLNPNGILGEIAHKGGPIGGPYAGATFSHEVASQAVPTRMVADESGKLYALFQTLNKDTDLPTGDYYLMTSTTNGATWQYDYTKPCLQGSALSGNTIYFDANTLDVSADGQTIYFGFISIYVEDERFTFTDNQFGYVRSTDGGNSWSEPVMYPLYTWDMGDTPVNTLDGFMYPSLAVAVDANKAPHFLISVNGRDSFYPLDSTLIGELTVNPDDPSEPPQFYALAMNIQPDYRRMINPEGETAPEQPTFSIWAEHEWSKDRSGKHLVAKWIDADSLFVFNPYVDRSHPDAIVRDSTHDIFILNKTIADEGNATHGWEVDEMTGTHNVVNVTQSVGVDEKFTKMNPIFNKYLYFIYTIMATGEFVQGQIYPDTDDLGPAELWLITHPVSFIVGVEDAASPSAFSLAQNYPNPVNAATSIRFSLERAMNVRVSVSDLLGRTVATLTDGFLDAGSHSVQFAPGNLAAGQYIYKLEAGGQAVTKMMSVVR